MAYDPCDDGIADDPILPRNFPLDLNAEPDE